MVKLNLPIKFLSPNDLAREARENGHISIDTSSSSSSSSTYQLDCQLAFDPKIQDPLDLLLYAKDKVNLSTDPRFANLNWVAERKYDGVRCRFIVFYIKDSINVIPLSRANRRFTSVDHLVKSVSDCMSLGNDNVNKLRDYIKSNDYRLILDGELIISGQPFRYINGLTNRKISDDETSNLSFVCFSSYITNSRFDIVSTINRQDHRDLIDSFKDTKIFKPAYCEITTCEKYLEFANTMKCLSAEGLILKSPDYRYNPRRTKHWLKLKFRKRGTYRLVDVVSGFGKCNGNAGSIQVEDKNGLTTYVGTGFTDADRIELSSLDLKSHTYYVDIAYMTKTGTSLREASYESVRYDLTDGSAVSVDEFEER